MIFFRNLNTDMIFENTMDDVKREADTLDSLTSNIKEIGTLVRIAVMYYMVNFIISMISIALLYITIYTTMYDIMI